MLRKDAEEAPGPTDVKAFVRIICAIALLLVGFAHQPPAIAMAGTQPLALAAYALPDGTIPDICFSEDGSHGDRHGPELSVCDACIIASSILLPSPADVAGRRLALTLAVIEPQQAETVRRRLFPPNAAPRAPPLSSFV